jgi:hypothetical protein
VYSYGRGQRFEGRCSGVRIPAHEHLERRVVTFGGANSELRILHLMA